MILLPRDAAGFSALGDEDHEFLGINALSLAAGPDRFARRLEQGCSA